MLTYKQVSDVNSQINNSITYKTDLEQYGVIEKWEYPRSCFGDCEDYALLKQQLLGEGNMMTCMTREGFGHAVLYVDTNEGGYILDNNDSTPMRPSALPYTNWRIWKNGKWYEASF